MCREFFTDFEFDLKKNLWDRAPWIRALTFKTFLLAVVGTSCVEMLHEIVNSLLACDVMNYKRQSFEKHSQAMCTGTRERRRTPSIAFIFDLIISRTY